MAEVETSASSLERKVGYTLEKKRLLRDATNI